MVNWPIVVIFTIIYANIRIKMTIKHMLDRADRTCDVVYKSFDDYHNKKSTH